VKFSDEEFEKRIDFDPLLIDSALALQTSARNKWSPTTTPFT
jgi:hypothetical protein